MNVRILLMMAACSFAGDGQIGRELGLTRHLVDGEEFRLPTSQGLSHGQLIFNANWTDQEGGGRPLTKGTGRPLSDPSRSRSRLRSEARAGRGALSSLKRNYHENYLDQRRGAYCGGGSGFRRNQGWAHGIGHHRR
jgi:hypothetical protein